MDISKGNGHLKRKQRMPSCPSLLLFNVIFLVFVVSPLCECCPLACTCVTTKVNCAGKGLRSLPADLPTDMTELDFSNNNLTSLGSREFVNYATKLELLDLSNNYIATVELDAFDSLTSLRKLYLQDNKLDGLPAKSFHDLYNVDTVDLSHNPLKGFPKGVFESCVRLSTLKIVDAELGPEAFKDMLNVVFLENLDISENNFSYLPYLMLRKYSRLRHLTISNAGVKYIDPNAFVGLLSLNYLKMDGNEIGRLNREVFQPLDKLSTLDLQRNPLVCDCGTAQFKDWQDHIGVMLIGTTTCMASNGKSLDIEKEDFSGLCSAVGPPTTPPPCTEDVKINMKVSEIRHDRVTVEWLLESAPGDLLLSANVRLYGKGTSNKDAQWEDLVISQKSHIFTGLTPGSPYALCFIQSKCALYSCVDFTTEQDPEAGALKDPVCISTEFTAGVAAASAFLALVFGMFTVYLILRGVCCCSGNNKNNKDDFNPPTSHVPSSLPNKRTQHVIPMQLSKSYIPSPQPHPNPHSPLQSSTSVGDTYDAIPLERIEPNPSGKVFHNPNYHGKERHVNDPLPIPRNSTGSHNEQATGSPDSTLQMIKGISSAYLHPDNRNDKSATIEHAAPQTYLKPMETLKCDPSTRPADPTLRHTASDGLSNSEPYHVYQEAMDDITNDRQPPGPQSSHDKPSAAMLRKQFASKLPSLDDIRRQMETGTGRMKKYRRPTPQSDLQSISTPNVLAANEKAQGTLHTQSVA